MNKANWRNPWTQILTSILECSSILPKLAERKLYQGSSMLCFSAENWAKSIWNTWCLFQSKSGVDLQNILTDLLQNERWRHKLLGGVRWHAPPGNFFHFNYLKCPFLAFWVSQTIYFPVPFFLNESLQISKLFRQSQCPCCYECAARQVLSI